VRYRVLFETDDDSALANSVNYGCDYPWIELSIDGTKYDVNSKYLYGTTYDEA
jgi:hypothetical protein